MIYNKNNFLIHTIAGNDNPNPVLNSVLFRGNKTVATDSFSLIEITNPESMENNDDFPVIDGKQLESPDFMVKLPTVKKVLSNIKPYKELPILENAVFLECEDDEVKIATTDLETSNIIKSKSIIGRYPQYESIIPDDDSEHRKIIINKEKLFKMLQVLNKMDIDENEIEVCIKDEKNPILLKGKTKQGQEVKALIMPIKS